MTYVGSIEIGNGAPLALIAGPCVIEGERDAIEAATAIGAIAARRGVPHIFKSSYDKANRTSLTSFRGPGLEKGLRILEKVRAETGALIYTDVHSPEQAIAAGEVCDAIQIPAFLCRQTDLLVAAGKTGKPVFVKKGQFMAPWDMGPVVKKLGTDQIVLIDRGFSFGYNNLVTDMRAIPIMKEFAPVCFDGTHSVQLPGGQGTCSGGQREFVAPLARAAVAAGADALYLETHPDPANAKCDGPNMLSFEMLETLLAEATAIREALATCSAVPI